MCMNYQTHGDRISQQYTFDYDTLIKLLLIEGVLTQVVITSSLRALWKIDLKNQINPSLNIVKTKQKSKNIHVEIVKYSR